MGIFDNPKYKKSLVEADVFSAPDYLRAGRYLAKIAALKEGENRSGEVLFITELQIVKVIKQEDNSHTVGDIVSYLVKMKSVKGAGLNYFWQELKLHFGGMLSISPEQVNSDDISTVCSSDGEPSPLVGFCIEINAKYSGRKSTPSEEFPEGVRYLGRDKGTKRLPVSEILEIENFQNYWEDSDIEELYEVEEALFYD